MVSKWKTPEEEMVAYRSFRPFFPLMAPAQPFPVQMWASWAIHHVCSKNGEFLLLPQLPSTKLACEKQR